MSQATEKLEVGDVFKCAELANATYKLNHDTRQPDKGQLEVNGAKEVIYHWTEHGEDGWSRVRQDLVNLDANDPSRGTAEFVVIHTEMSGGGTGHGPHDVYPDGWGVRAKRLKDDGTFDPDGEEVFFRQSGCFRNTLTPEVTEKIRQMAMQFVGS